ncbi:MAG: LysR family transcriptional regulator [Comamonadaceae bacterium]|nr:LysR family transcriptional regulator [Comamonadaceae bacterium]
MKTSSAWPRRAASRRSAQLRHVTQPAFSRRIQALEAWAGIDLVDRSSYPTRLTPAGETLPRPGAGDPAGAAGHAHHAAQPRQARAGRDRVRGAAHAGLHASSRTG